MKIKKYMVRPIINKIFTRCFAGVFISVAYSYYMFHKVEFNAVVVNYPLLTFGCVCIMMAWFNYLKFDGIKVNFGIDEANREKKMKKVKHKTKQMIDYSDEKIISYQELLDGEKLICNTVANLVSGIMLIIPSITLLF